MIDILKKFVVPLVVLDNDREKIHGGTAFLWKSIEDFFVVTAAHVWTGLIAKKQKLGHSASLGLLGDRQFNRCIDFTPVDLDEDLDLCILRTNQFEGEFPPAGRQFYGALRWPPPPLSSGETVALYGFPGQLRIMNKSPVIIGGLYNEERCQVTKSGKSIYLSPESPRRPQFIRGLKKVPFSSFGGISGAPVFSDRDGKIDWVAVTRSGGDGPVKTSSIRATPTSFISASGTILR